VIMADSRRRTKGARRRTKDKVLQARIPEDLDVELRDRAEQLGLSVSTVVRNVLLHTFDLVEGVVADSAQLARVVQGRDTAAVQSLPAPDADEDTAVIGWQQAILNRNGVCEQCNDILAKGDTAAVGVPVQARPVLLCLRCLGELTATDQTPAQITPDTEEPTTPTPSRRRKKPTT
jgi:hypothetical protein